MESASQETLGNHHTPPDTAFGAPILAKSMLPEEAILASTSRRDDQWRTLCSAPDDVASQKLCAARAANGPAWPTSLQDVLSALGLGFKSPIGNGELGNPSFALLSHSTSLASKLVSPINPRAFIFSNPATEGPIEGKARSDSKMIAVTFTRGEPLVEIVSRRASNKELRFLLIRFELPCESEDAGCSNWNRFGPSIEQNWRGATPFTGEDLENTIFDCNVCHQPAGPGSPRMLRMVERKPPWTHFFRDKEGGRLLLDDYFSAHGMSETYGAIPGRLITWSEPARLEGLIEHEGFGKQPVELATAAVTRYEMRGKAPKLERHYEEIFASFLSGTNLPVPYPATRFADPGRLSLRAQEYRLAMAGPEGQGKLQSFDALHTEEAAARAGRAVDENADGKGILLAACATCHNPRLDSSLSRSRFDATTLDRMSKAERQEAVTRMNLPRESPYAMPPARFTSLTPEQIARATEALELGN